MEVVVPRVVLHNGVSMPQLGCNQTLSLIRRNRIAHMLRTAYDFAVKFLPSVD